MICSLRAKSTIKVKCDGASHSVIEVWNPLRSCIILSVTGKPRAGVIIHRQGHSSTLIRIGDGHNTKTGLKWQIHFVGVEEGKPGIFSLLVHARCLIR